MHGNNFNNNEFVGQNMNNNNNMINQNNYNNSGQNNINYNSFDTRICTNDNDSQNNNNIFGNNYQEYINNNNKMINNNNNANNNQNINENNPINPAYYVPDDNNTLSLSSVDFTKKKITEKNLFKGDITSMSQLKIIEPGNFNPEEIDNIKNICISEFNTSNPLDQTNIDKISQKLKLKYDGEWFVLICEQSAPKKRLNFDFKFSNLDWKDILIFSQHNFRFYIGKIKNINN